MLPTEDEVVAPDSPLVQFRDGFGTALGVGGYIWLSADEGGSTIEGRCEPESDCTKAQPTSLCVRGEVGQVLDGNWGAHWGAALGWNLAQDAEPGSRVSVLRAPSVRGFEFDLALDEGSSTEMRLSVRSREVEFCAQLAPGKNSIRWNDLKANCWEPGGEGLDPEVETVTAVKWQLVSQEARPLPFDFCVENLTLL